MRSAGGPPPGWVVVSVFALVVMATWTLVVKFLAPAAWFAAERAAGRAAAGPPVMWDFWWIAHLALAWMLWRRDRRAWLCGVAVAAAEVVIVAVKLAAYWQRPDLSFWRLLWLTNKVYVLAFFVLFLVLLTRPGARLALEGRHV